MLTITYTPIFVHTILRKIGEVVGKQTLSTSIPCCKDVDNIIEGGVAMVRLQKIMKDEVEVKDKDNIEIQKKVEDFFK